jgi:hypothetical protein
MMVRTEQILKVVPEEGTAIFRLVCKDEDGVLTIPVTMFWDLTALDGKVIAYNQAIAVLANTMYLPVYGTNMRILEGEESYGERLITFRGTYNSTRGNNLPLRKQIKFRVQNLKLIGYPLSVAVTDAIFTDDYPKEVKAV